jgi:hypothetical protein
MSRRVVIVLACSIVVGFMLWGIRSGLTVNGFLNWIGVW